MKLHDVEEAFSVKTAKIFVLQDEDSAMQDGEGSHQSHGSNEYHHTRAQKTLVRNSKHGPTDPEKKISSAWKIWLANDGYMMMSRKNGKLCCAPSRTTLWLSIGER